MTKSDRYTMGLFEENRYKDVWIIYDRELGYMEGRVAVLPGGSLLNEKQAQRTLDAFNTQAAQEAAEVVEEAMQPIPTNLEEAIKMCTELVIFGAGESIFERSEKEFTAMCHHNLGQRMRNAWGLWSMDSELFRTLAGETCLSHADDLSGLILTATYRKFNDLEFELLKEAAKYHNHWKQMFSGRGLSVVL
jgi:hypothetical protein